MAEQTERDLDGRVFVITGANTGIGKATAMALAHRGARVILACRSQDKTRPAIDDIKAKTQNDAVEFLGLDLADLASIHRAADALAARDIPIHALVNNAGVAGQRGQTKDGFELAFGINHLGHFALTTRLLDKLTASAPARIVNVSSASHYSAKHIDWDAIHKPTATLTALREYAVSKLANVLFTAELARRLDGTGVTSYAVHPGVIASDVWRRVPWPFRPLIKTFMKSNEEGAQTQLRCATAPELADETGLYYDDCKQKTPSRLARDEALAAELWHRSEQLTGARSEP